MVPAGNRSKSQNNLPLRVLVVDDSDDSRELVSFFLSKAFNTEVHTARNGREAIDFLQHQGVDLVFLDIEMPVMDGYAAASLLKTNPLTASVPLLAMTAHTGEEEIERALACGCIGYVSKPFTREALEQAVLRHVPSAGTASVAFLPGATAKQNATAALRDSYRASRLRNAREIPALLAADDLYQIERLACVMQKTADDYGLGVVGAIGTRLERAVNAGDRQEISAAAEELERVLLDQPGIPGS